jgi:hypothetical protein
MPLPFAFAVMATSRTPVGCSTVTVQSSPAGLSARPSATVPGRRTQDETHSPPVTAKAACVLWGTK